MWGAGGSKSSLPDCPAGVNGKRRIANAGAAAKAILPFRCFMEFSVVDLTTIGIGMGEPQGHRYSCIAPLLVRACISLCAFLLLQPCAVAVPANGPTAYEQAILAIQKQIATGNLDQARVLIADSVRRYPHDGGVENLLGVVEIQQNHTAAASDAFSHAIPDNP